MSEQAETKTVFGMAPEKLLKVLLPVILALVTWGISVEVDRRTHVTADQVEAKISATRADVAAELGPIKARTLELEKLNTRLEAALRSIQSSIAEVKIDLRELRTQLQPRRRSP